MIPAPPIPAEQTGLLPGFAEPVDAAQRVFRAVLEGMSFPGRIVSLPVDLAPPAPLTPSLGAVLLALADLETPVWLAPGFATPAVKAWLAFHCGCPVVDSRERATFAIVTPEDGLAGFPIGSAEHPETAITLLVPVPRLAYGPGLHLTGPGIPDYADLSVPVLSGALLGALAENPDLFPQGRDVVLAAPEQIACLPRTTRIRPPGEGRN
jgi:alpha-D-ribose 1-methylphosphonate 5-triphosphate synthase subunit PhnH